MLSLFTQKRTMFFALGVAFVLMSINNKANAYCQRRTESQGPQCNASCPTGGEPIRWTESCFDYVINREGSKSVGTAGVRNAIDNAFRQWTNIRCNGQSVGLNANLRPESGSCKDATFSCAGDTNHLVFLNSLRAMGGDENTFALTSTWNRTNGEIVGWDMFMNEGAWTFADCQQEVCGPKSVDLQTVLVHETGHALGLAHSASRDAVMYACNGSGEIKRILSPDDESGFCSIYGDGTLRNKACAPTANAPFSLECHTETTCDSGCGCRSAKQGDASSVTLLLLAFGMIMVRFRRRAI